MQLRPALRQSQPLRKSACPDSMLPDTRHAANPGCWAVRRSPDRACVRHVPVGHTGRGPVPADVAVGSTSGEVCRTDWTLAHRSRTAGKALLLGPTGSIVTVVLRERDHFERSMLSSNLPVQQRSPLGPLATIKQTSWVRNAPIARKLSARALLSPLGAYYLALFGFCQSAPTSTSALILRWRMFHRAASSLVDHPGNRRWTRPAPDDRLSRRHASAQHRRRGAFHSSSTQVVLGRNISTVYLTIM